MPDPQLLNDLDNLALRDAVFSIETYLRPSLRGPGSAMEQAGARLAAGALVVIRGAFEPAFAERMHRSLDACTTWLLYEKHEEHFHYHHHDLYRERNTRSLSSSRSLPREAYPPDLAWCDKVFGSAMTRAWATRLSGRLCEGPTVFTASWYLPGDHSLPHTDAIRSGSDGRRQVAFVWHLAKDWQPEWGGALFWCPKALYLPPVFNTLVLFNVGPATSHFVTQVSPSAQGKRLAINGWWTGPAGTGEQVEPTPDRICANGTPIEVY
jgi:hypothetical protein